MNKELIKIILLGALIVVASFWFAGRFIQPAPPRAFTIAAGSAGGAYLTLAHQYAELLSEDGIQVTVLETEGSLENIALLQEGRADVAFVQTGVAVPADSGIEGLGALYYEPLWLFTRGHEPLRQLTDLKGKRISVGPEGSGTKAVTLAILAEHGLDEQNVTLLSLGGAEALEALTADRIDASFTIAAMSSASVMNLLSLSGLRLARLDLADALARRLPFLKVITIPRGMLDPARDYPSEEIKMLSPVASLAAREDFHPALVDLVLMTAATLHAPGDLLAAPGTFPAPHPTAAPLGKEAERHFSSGLPFLKRILPFWAATLISRMWVMIIPLLTILIPLLKIIPPTYHWRLRSQLFRLYRQLRDVDSRRMKGGESVDRAALLDEVRRIEVETDTLTVPLSYYDRVYHLKLHVRFVREQLGG
jgi:TRAP transporter TAXI family solute receptor